MAGTLQERKQSNSVQVEVGSILIQHFEEADPDVVEVVSRAEDKEGAVHDLLQVAARCAKVAKVTLEAAVLDEAVDELTSKFDHSVAEAVGRVAEVSEALLSSEDGDLRQILDDVKSNIAKTLDGFSDPDSKKSAVSRIEAVLDEAASKQERAIRKVIDPASEDSPLRAWRREMEEAIKKQGDSIAAALKEISEKIAVDHASAELKEKTAIKGFDFEDLIHDLVAGVVSPHADVAERVGSVTGLTGGKSGDEIVTLNLEDTRNVAARYVLECKDRKLALRKALDEVAEGMKNRDALAGIAVFSSRENAPIDDPFQPYGDKAVVVIDKYDPDPSVLKLACLWARWVVRRELNDRGEDLDADRIASLIEDGRRALSRASTVKRALSGAKRKVEEAEDHLDTMATGLEQVLGDICAEIEPAISSSTEPETIYLAINGTEGGGPSE